MHFDPIEHQLNTNEFFGGQDFRRLKGGSIL